MNFSTIYRAALRKRAAAILTPEAEQAAVQGGMPPQGAPTDPAAMAGAPAGPAAQGGMPPAATGAQGGQIPPEILQDQGFIQWLASQGVQLDPQSGTFIDMQSGQPLPAEAIAQAYQMYMEQMQASQGMPADPAAAGAGAVPPGAAPAGTAPADPGMGGGVPPELLQDPGFAQFLQTVGIAADPQSGQAVDMQSGQPLPPEVLTQVAQAYMQQAQGGGMPQEQAAPGMPEAPGAAAAQPGLPPEVMEQLQSAIDASIQNYTAQLDKKIETLLDKLDTVKQAVESFRDTDDKRSQEEKDEIKAAQDDLAAELAPVTKTASAGAAPRKAKAPKATAPANIFELLLGK